MKKILITLFMVLLSACNSIEEDFTYFDFDRSVKYQQITDENIYEYKISFDLKEKPVKVYYFLELRSEFFVRGSLNHKELYVTDPKEVIFNNGYLINETIFDRSFQANIWDTTIVIIVEYPNRKIKRTLIEYGG